ncbi:MAG: hypothetical protein R3331_09105 [Sulfurospirillaceae bacterium]|nr:hypothetical protein [Sulfurospirillaceae bacterium]
MGNITNNSVKMENGYKLAELYKQQKNSFIASQKQKDKEAGGVNSNIAKMKSDAKKAKEKAKAKKAKKDRKRNK